MSKIPSAEEIISVALEDLAAIPHNVSLDNIAVALAGVQALATIALAAATNEQTKAVTYRYLPDITPKP